MLKTYLFKNATAKDMKISMVEDGEGASTSDSEKIEEEVKELDC
jgi:hypothetical protein